MRVAGGDQLIGLGVVERHRLEVDLDIPALAYEPQARGDDVEVLQAEEVDLQQADVADRLHVVLRDHRLAAGAVLQRREMHQRFGSDDNARRVRAHVA